jgi:CHASE2 domain-containing sensor protein
MSAGSQSPPDPELLAHERTYRVFNILLRWCMVLLASTITGLTLWFATPAGFMGGVFTGLVLLAAGYVVLIPHEEHQPLDPFQEGR